MRKPLLADKMDGNRLMIKTRLQWNSKKGLRDPSSWHDLPHPFFLLFQAPESSSTPSFDSFPGDITPPPTYPAPSALGGGPEGRAEEEETGTGLKTTFQSYLIIFSC